jgi:hypothetical protein
MKQAHCLRTGGQARGQHEAFALSTIRQTRVQSTKRLTILHNYAAPH